MSVVVIPIGFWQLGLLSNLTLSMIVTGASFLAVRFGVFCLASAEACVHFA